MPGERIQRRIESLLDEADAAAGIGDWADFGSWRMRRQTGEQVAE